MYVSMYIKIHRITNQGNVIFSLEDFHSFGDLGYLSVSKSSLSPNDILLKCHLGKTLKLRSLPILFVPYMKIET